MNFYQPALSYRVKARGFTLLELIVVITIIGILATIVVVRTGGITQRGRRMQAEADMRNILTVAEALYTDNGSYPSSIEDMVNAKRPDGSPAIASLEKYPKDPWGNDYAYEVNSNRPQVTCFGSDKSAGGEEEAEDIVRPEPESR